jgi:hypothetical protein
MKTLDLDFTKRFKLGELLGAQSGTLGKTAPYLRILNLLRFTEAENNQITRVQISDTQVSYQAPTRDFGCISIDVENADCAALLELMESHPGFTTSDHVWADPLLEKLKAP